MTDDRAEAWERLGDAVRDARIALGLNHRDAATAAGIAPSTWLRLEHGGAVRESTLYLVADILHWPAELPGQMLHAPDRDEERLDAIERRVAAIEVQVQEVIAAVAAAAAPEIRRRLQLQKSTGRRRA